MNFRKYFLRAQHFDNLCRMALRICEPGDQSGLGVLCVKIFVNVCSLSGTRIYIPGETTVAEQLRKRAFECGIYAVLVYISAAIGNQLK